MIDIKILNADTENTKNRLASRNPKYVELADKILETEKSYKSALLEVETLRAKRNELSKKIGFVRAKEGPAAAEEVMKEANNLKETMQGKEQEVAALKDKITEILLTVPNLPDLSVPVGADEKANVVVKENTLPVPQFDFKIKDHHELGENLGILDFATAAKLSGSRFALLRGDGARLERA